MKEGVQRGIPQRTWQHGWTTYKILLNSQLLMYFDRILQGKMGHILPTLENIQLAIIYTTGGGHSVLEEREGSFFMAHLFSCNLSRARQPLLIVL